MKRFTFSHTLKGGRMNPEILRTLGEVQHTFTPSQYFRYDGTEPELLNGYYNRYSRDVVLKDSYQTTANGGADQIILKPGEAIFCTSPGSAYCFAHYVVFKVEEVQQ